MGVSGQARLADQLVELSRQLLKGATVGDVLARATEWATEQVPGCEHAGTCVAEGDAVGPGPATSAVAARIDEAQCETGQGPCLESIASRGLVHVPALALESRWPRFRPLAAAAGLGSVLSVPLVFDEMVVGAINMYAGGQHAFDDTDHEFVLLYALEAALAVGLARAREQAAIQAGQLQQALLSRDVIGQAKGIIMERERVTADQAFDVLRRASQHHNVKLRELAEQVAATGQLPSNGAAPSAAERIRTSNPEGTGT